LAILAVFSNFKTVKFLAYLFVNLSILYFSIYSQLAIFHIITWSYLPIPFFVAFLGVFVYCIHLILSEELHICNKILFYLIVTLITAIFVVLPVILLVIKLDDLAPITNLAILILLILLFGLLSVMRICITFCLPITPLLLLEILTPASLTTFFLFMFFHLQFGTLSTTWTLLPLELFIAFFSFQMYAYTLSGSFHSFLKKK